MAAIDARNLELINQTLPKRMIEWTGVTWKVFYDDWTLIADGYNG
jgi:hypothetical protein